MFFTCLHKSQRQNFDQFSNFCKDFSMPLNNVNDHRPSCSVMFCFNATYSKWNSLDKDNATGEVLQTYTTAVSYSQLIKKSTHCVNSSSY